MSAIQKLSLSAEGHSYKNFQVTKYCPLDELKSSLIELVHEPTGARVLHIANDDPENLFCLSFQTLPTSSNGAAHILEHTVLCGSKKFPVKDPFFAMTRRSLNTFMNAFTGQDFTSYPASSQVEKDFYNLLEVYLDAVFHPELKKTSFLQEGHRLAFSTPNDPSSPLQYQGIVYNEMKGALMGADARLWHEMAQILLPDLPYCHNSGGDPKNIPELTYEELLEFHKAFYHPSRCLFYFYGNFPLVKHLDFIEKNALQHAGKLSLLPPLPLQKRFHAPVHKVAHYPIAEGESVKNKTEIAFSWLTAHLSDQADVLALSLLESFLMETDASPLKAALLKSGLCKDADSSIDTEMSEVPLTITCKGCEPQNGDKLRSLLFQTLHQLVSKKLDEELIEAALHQLEFQRTEIGSEHGPFGLALFFRAGLIAQHGCSPELSLQAHTLFADLRDRLKDPSYLPSIIRKYLLENTHFGCLVLSPDPEMEKKELEEERSRLDQIQKHLSDEDKRRIIAQSEELKKYQEALERQSLDCLPKVTLQDVPKESRDFPLSQEQRSAFDLFHHDCFTNQILYADLCFDVPEVDERELCSLSLLSKMWTELGCAKQSYEETLNRIQSHSGGIDAHLSLHVSSLNPDALKPSFSLRGKALQRKAGRFMDLLNDLTKGPTFEEKERVKEWLHQHATELQDSLAYNPLSYAIHLSLSGLSVASRISNDWHGLPYYHYVRSLADSKSDEWIDRLADLSERILTNGKPHLILSCEENQLEELRKGNFFALGDREPLYRSPPWSSRFEVNNVPSQSRIISSPVAFTSFGLRTASYRDSGVAELMISTELLGNTVLHKEVREKGGAYGSGASYSPNTGNYHLYSYRDPHLSRTLSTFRTAIEKIADGFFDERELEEAKIGLIAAIDSPVAPGGRAVAAYSWLRSGRTLADRQALRGQILSASRESVMQTVSKELLDKPAAVVSLLGKQLWQKEGPLAPGLASLPL